ncbi:long-chain fatty acid--CoA ligase [Microbulbifer elongatus]|uniref:long-chain fatty acid--CoA ligase n=1 Tax=Microbulbifer elongatus TaxID=86173 RepID=UPI001E5BD8FD|nr:long-chain fatty acid--CoA ligase [Microbulbifer elongatus]
MLGKMMQWPLLVSRIFKYATQFHGEQTIVSVCAGKPNFRYSYREFGERVCQLANALTAAGVKPGDRVATLAWNDHRHLELYYAISGIGAVCHTINPRLFPAQMEYIVHHADDVLLFADPAFVDLISPIAGGAPSLRQLIWLGDEDRQSSEIDTTHYEAFIAGHSKQVTWPELDENSASSLCYTSGTTGNPKGVLYSHRSTVLHSMAVTGANALNIGLHDAVLPVFPLFHVNAWGIPYSALLNGAKLVLPGPKLDGESLYKLIAEEEVTVTAGVPTIWLALQNHLRDNSLFLESLKRMIVGGSAAPRSMIEYFEEQQGVEFIHAWGMTEMSPVGTICKLKSHLLDSDREARSAVRVTQGLPVFGVEMKLVDDDGEVQPHNGEAIGEVWVRGPWITSGYYEDAEADEDKFDREGFFRTGDVASFSRDGYMRICDRSKDVIKTGGEWISSIDLENAAIGHPLVAEAAVIGVSSEKWAERPLLVIVPRDPQTPPTLASMHDYLGDKVPKWWLPDAMELVEQLPHTATGKIQKRDLREQFKDYQLP